METSTVFQCKYESNKAKTLFDVHSDARMDTTSNLIQVHHSTFSLFFLTDFSTIQHEVKMRNKFYKKHVL